MFGTWTINVAKRNEANGRCSHFFHVIVECTSQEQVRPVFDSIQRNYPAPEYSVTASCNENRSTQVDFN